MFDEVSTAQRFGRSKKLFFAFLQCSQVQQNF